MDNNIGFWLKIIIECVNAVCNIYRTIKATQKITALVAQTNGYFLTL